MDIIAPRINSSAKKVIKTKIQTQIPYQQKNKLATIVCANMQ